MQDLFIVYAFLGLMAFNLLASFVYLMGFAQIHALIRRAYQKL